MWRTLYKSKEPLSTIKNLLCNGKAPWMLKVLHGTIDANTKLCMLIQLIVSYQLGVSYWLTLWRLGNKTAFDMHSKSMLIHFQVIMYKKLMKYDCNANILKRYLQNQGMKRDCEQNQKREDFLGDHPVSPVTSRVWKQTYATNKKQYVLY